MTPAAHWSPQDYYRASRAARRAWEKTSEQLSFGALEETEEPHAGMRAVGAPVAAASSVSSSALVRAPSPLTARAGALDSALRPTSSGPTAPPPKEDSGRAEGGQF